MFERATSTRNRRNVPHKQPRRPHRESALAPRPLRCPSCGVDRFTFDTKGGGFQRHIDEDHCMWRYLYCLCYLWDKVPTEYNGWEQHVAAKLAAGDFSFLPQNNAIVLRKLWMAKEEEHQPHWRQRWADG